LTDQPGPRDSSKFLGRIGVIIILAGLGIGFGFGFLQSRINRNGADPLIASITSTAPGIVPLPTPTGISLADSLTGIATEKAQEQEAVPGVGRRAPDFSLQTLDGDILSLQEFAGQPVLINFWASWCIPCLTEMPLIEAAYTEYQPTGLVVLAVNDTRNDSPEEAEKFTTDLGLTFPILLDSGYKVTYPLYRVIQLPMSFFVDSEGIIQDILIGQMGEEQLRQGLEKILPVE
jgi:peroxiredoxin